MNNCKVVGLTGQTGAGKSTVSRLLAQQGFPVIDCDEVSRYVVANEKRCLADLALTFSIAILEADGTLNRKRLGNIVFGNPDRLARLNEIIFPYIRAEIDRRLTAFAETGAALVILDAPTLFESGADAVCDAVVSVIAPVEQRLNRIIVRDHLSDDEARQRIASQQPDEFYASRSKLVLQNDGDAEELHVKVLEVAELLRRALAAESKREDV